MSNNPPSLQTGVIIKGKWKVIKKIGQGAFGEIFSGRNILTSESVAIKVERVDSEKQVLKLEVAVLKKLQSCVWVVPFVACGRHVDFNFLVMELLGENIAELRRMQQGRFSMPTTLKLGIQMIKGIENVHEFGYLHRDIKPSNFAMGLAEKKRQTCFLIDFGLARRYVLPDGEIRPPRDCAGFRGTARYASIHSHQSRDLGRRDDLWSVLYLLIEFALGQLPWRKERDKDKVGDMKVKHNNDELVAGLPPEFLQFMKHLMSLHYHSRPDYGFLINMFEDLYKRLGGTDKTPFDWEMPSRDIVRRHRPLPSLLDFSFIKVVSDAKTVLVGANAEKMAKIPTKMKNKMIQFFLRINDGIIPDYLLDKLISSETKEIDLSLCRMSGEEMVRMVRLFGGALENLKLGAVSDDVLKEFVENNSKLEQLSFTGGKAASEKALKFIVSSCPQLKGLEVIDCDKLTDKAVEGVLKQCEHLTSLGLRNCKKIKGTALKVFVGQKGAIRSTKALPCNLKTLDLSGCPLSKGGVKKLIKVAAFLETLILHPLLAKSAGGELGSLVQFCGNLKRLELSLGKELNSLEEVFGDIPQRCQYLEKIHIGGQQLTEKSVVEILTHLQHLRDVSLTQESDNGIAATSLPRTLKLCTKLERIHVKFGEPLYKQGSISDSALKQFLHSCTAVTHLSLTECLVLSPSCFPDNGYYAHLKFLDLSDCVQIQDNTIKQITDAAPHLTTLKLNRLQLLSSRSLEAIAHNCPLLEKCELKKCACFHDNDLKVFLRKCIFVFLTVTRYAKKQGDGIEKEVHFCNVDDVFAHYPNNHRESVCNNAPR
eukprot:CAMPEP_0201515182 /NCGR_PEP_ID=MMETSP0161_2-20130828/6822_1 /ASSEMBLY_ACC=CAM_ASM_000251 /TAXON_ID=180227 /ORGANISM="Neoparamoeba aestuarina, Strain SoJaBio B1-5/56/2" /LENGTH=820 /DNA_ID=CAMNT_0047911943 /DNA_START=79 /DNA_END=2541 /DNA_ORIENTATION=+